MDSQRFLSGSTFDEYLNKMDPANRDGFLAAYQSAALTQEQAAKARSINKTVYALAVSESWCGDCRINVPVLARLAEANSHVVLRCHGKDASIDLGIEKIPTFIFYDEAFVEIGRWVERPVSVGSGLATADHDAKRELRRRYNAGEFHAETFSELANLAVR